MCLGSPTIGEQPKGAALQAGRCPGWTPCSSEPKIFAKLTLNRASAPDWPQMLHISELDDSSSQKASHSASLCSQRWQGRRNKPHFSLQQQTYTHWDFYPFALVSAWRWRIIACISSEQGPMRKRDKYFRAVN